MKFSVCFNMLRLEDFVHHKLEIKERPFLKGRLILFFNFLSFCYHLSRNQYRIFSVN